VGDGVIVGIAEGVIPHGPTVGVMGLSGCNSLFQKSLISASRSAWVSHPAEDRPKVSPPGATNSPKQKV
jgi:hypothetical protein